MVFDRAGGLVTGLRSAARGFGLGSGGARAGPGRSGLDPFGGSAGTLSAVERFEGLAKDAVALGDVTRDGFEGLAVVGEDGEGVGRFKKTALEFIGALEPLPGLCDRGDEHALVRVGRVERLCEVVAGRVDGIDYRVELGGSFLR